MIKIALSAGHNIYTNYFDCGATGNSLTEAECTKEIVQKMIYYFSFCEDVEVKDVTPYNQKFTSSEAAHLERSKRIDAYSPHMYFDIHLNSGGGTGVECYTYSSTSAINVNANRITNGISKNFSVANRGLKHNKNYWSLSLHKAPSCIVECLFIDSSKDMSVFNADKMAKTICETILNREIKIPVIVDNSCSCLMHGTITATVLNVRATPNGKIIGSLKQGEKVSVVEKALSGWLKIIYNSHVAYISGDYFKPDETLIEKNEYYRTARKFDSLLHIFESDKDTKIDITKGKVGLEPLSKIKTTKGEEICKTNCGFFLLNGSSEHLGFYLDEGTCDSNTSSEYMNLLFYKDNTTKIIKYNNKLTAEDLKKLKEQVQWAIATSYSLVIDGKINIQNSQYFSSTTKEPRTLLGQKKDGTWISVVIDGRGKNSSLGVTAKESAEIMLQLGCVNAVNLDGGGSSEMIFRGNIVNSPTDGRERNIGSAIIFYK